MAASRTRKGLTLNALLRAAAWYTAPMAAASSALMFFPSSSLRTNNKQMRFSVTESTKKKNIAQQLYFNNPSTLFTYLHTSERSKHR